MTPVLFGAGLSKRYGDLRVLSDVDFAVGAGEAVGIVGPNGAGKTTLLSVLAGSVAPSAGTVRLDGHDITTLGPALRCRRGIGRAFQVPRPFGRMTVLENVVVGASYGAGTSGRAAYRQCVQVLELCGLVELANRPAEDLGLLSRKRLELARAPTAQGRPRCCVPSPGRTRPPPDASAWTAGTSPACPHTSASRRAWRWSRRVASCSAR
jgi:branched-chain amino acid transport system ATP-binding protein